MVPKAFSEEYPLVVDSLRMDVKTPKKGEHDYTYRSDKKRKKKKKSGVKSKAGKERTISLPVKETSVSEKAQRKKKKKDKDKKKRKKKTTTEESKENGQKLICHGNNIELQSPMKRIIGRPVQSKAPTKSRKRTQKIRLSFVSKDAGDLSRDIGDNDVKVAGRKDILFGRLNKMLSKSTMKKIDVKSKPVQSSCIAYNDKRKTKKTRPRSEKHEDTIQICDDNCDKKKKKKRKSDKDIKVRLKGNHEQHEAKRSEDHRKDALRKKSKSNNEGKNGKKKRKKEGKKKRTKKKSEKSDRDDQNKTEMSCSRSSSSKTHGLSATSLNSRGGSLPGNDSLDLSSVYWATGNARLNGAPSEEFIDSLQRSLQRSLDRSENEASSQHLHLGKGNSSKPQISSPAPVVPSASTATTMAYPSSPTAEVEPVSSWWQFG